MCEQSEVSYRPGNVVWVKLGPVWWPGVVADDEEIPAEVLKTLRKTPIAIVKFFQEKEFEYVHKLSNIYHYNCLRKNDFIRKGLDTYRSKSRDGHSNMKLFPEDVARAEVLTGGNPNILNDEKFQPEQKPVYSDFFASTKKSPKKVKPDNKKKSLIQGETKQSCVPRIITHPRFIKLSSGMETDYEVRERKQEPIRAECDEEDNSPPTTYRCQDCDFTTIRLNVIVLHNKLHTRNYVQPPPSKTPKRKNISAVRVKERPSSNEWKSSQPAETVKPKEVRTNGTVHKTGKKGRPRKVDEPTSTVPVNVTTKTKEVESKKSSRASITKPKCDTPQKDEFQESLLEDWAEFETEQDNADTSFNSSSVDAPEAPASETTFDQNHSTNKKDEFDFDDSEEQLFIDKSKIRAGRKIPRVLEDKTDEIKNGETEKEKKVKISGTKGNFEEKKMEILEEEKIDKSENVRKRRLPGTRRKSEGTEIENLEEKRKSTDSVAVKKRKMLRTRGITQEEKGETNTESVSENNNDKSMIECGSEKIEETRAGETKDAQKITQAKIEESREKIEVANEIEIEIEETLDEAYEPSSVVEMPTSSANESENDAKEKETTELSQKVDQLLQEVSLPSQLPELPRSLKKEHIKSYNASLKQSKYDDQVIESISLLNDDSSDGFEGKSCTKNNKAVKQVRGKNLLSGKVQTSAFEGTNVDTVLESVEVNSDSSPEIVSVVDIPPRSGGLGKKTQKPIISTTTLTAAKRAPIRFEVMRKFKNVNSSQVTKRNANPMTGTGAAKVSRGSSQQSDRPITQTQMQLHSLQPLQSRTMLKKAKTSDGKNARLAAAGQQAIPISTNSAAKTNKYILVKQGSHPATIDKIDLTGPKNRRVSLVSTKPDRSTSNIIIQSPKNVTAMNRASSRGTTLRPSATVHKPVSSTVEFVSSSNTALIPVQDQSEIITVMDDIEASDSNEQTEEMHYFVDEAGNVIAENASTLSKKEDILAKALQDTDVLQTEMALSSSSTIVLEPCNIGQNTPSTTVYENVILNTPPIMSSFETPSRTNLNEISEYIIISDTNENL